MSEGNKLDFYGNTTPDKAFEIDLEIRNAKGEPTGIRKSLKTDDPVKLWEFYMRNQGRPKKRRKKTSKNKGGSRMKKNLLPTSKEADRIMSNMYTENNDSELGSFTYDQKGK